MLATTTLMAIGCETEATSPVHRGSGIPSSTEGSPPAGAAYDPQAPTNQGPAFNAAGFAAIAPVLEARCAECHHAGTWLALATGADEATAAKIVSTIEAGTMPPAPREPVTPDELARLREWRDGKTPEAAAAPAPVAPPAMPQVVDAAKLAAYRAALPAIAWKRLDVVLHDPGTLIWDKDAIPPAYQDTVGDGAGLPLGARLNSAGRSLIVPEGKKLFSDDGRTWAYPFGHTAGADASDVVVLDFLSLPVKDGGRLPIAYRIDTSTIDSLPVKRWVWSFPKGTLVGEIILVRDGDALITAEVRVRERWTDRWSTNVFRPFPTAKTLATAIRAARPGYADTPKTKALVDALENDATLTPKQLGSPAFGDMITLAGAVDAPLPEVGDDALVRDLLRRTPFVAAYGTTWKTDGAQRAFGPTGASSAGLSFVPQGFDTGLLEVRETTCQKCHDQGGTFIGDLVDQAILYGDVWGVDRVFSFHPFEPSLIDASGNENRQVRQAFGSIVVPYSAASHPADVYTFYRPTGR